MKEKHLYTNTTTILFFILFLLTSCATKRTSLQGLEKWEKDITDFEKLDQTEKYADNALLFVGSSSIRLWSTIKDEMAPYPIIQRGFGGSNSPAVLAYIQRIVYPHPFSAIVIFIANDITGSPTDLTPKESADNFRNIVKSIRTRYKKQPVFIVEITPCQSRWKKWPAIQQNNARLEAFCKKGKNLYFIETAQNFLNEKGEPRNELFRDDHLHLNREGYKVWGGLIKHEVDKRLKVKG